MQPALFSTKLAWRREQVTRIFFLDERRLGDCPHCRKPLSPGEVAEQWCEDCGPLTPREMRGAA